MKGRDYSYKQGNVLYGEEGKDTEYKCLKRCKPFALQWKIMNIAKKYICACLNAAKEGTIYFGVGDCLDKTSGYEHGEIIGLQVEKEREDITRALQCVLDHHIESDGGPLMKGGDQGCVSIYFVPVEIKRKHLASKLYIVEIEVERDWKFCKDYIYRSKLWTPARVGVRRGQSKELKAFFNVIKDQLDDVFIRANAESQRVIKGCDVQYHVRNPLKVKFDFWSKQNAQHGKCILWLFTSFLTML